MFSNRRSKKTPVATAESPPTQSNAGRTPTNQSTSASSGGASPATNPNTPASIRSGGFGAGRGSSASGTNRTNNNNNGDDSSNNNNNITLPPAISTNLSGSRSERSNIYATGNSNGQNSPANRVDDLRPIPKAKATPAPKAKATAGGGVTGVRPGSKGGAPTNVSPPPPLKPLPPDVVIPNKVETCRLIKQHEKCPVCQEPNPSMAALCCGTAYHMDCLCDWLRLHNSCPQCRGVIPNTLT